MGTFSMPWPVAREYRAEAPVPDEQTHERRVRIRLLAATNAAGFDARQIMFARFRTPPDLRNRVIRSKS